MQLDYETYFEKEKRKTAYASGDELITEVLRLLDLLLERCLDSRGGYPREGSYARGLAVTDAEIRSYLDTPPRERVHDRTDTDLAGQLSLAYGHIDSRVQQTKARRPDIGTALWDVRKLFALTDLEYISVLLACSVQFELRYLRLYAYLQDDINAKLPTVGLAATLAGLCGSIETSDVQRVLEKESKMMVFFFEADTAGKYGAGLLTPLVLRRQMLGWLIGVPQQLSDGVFKKYETVHTFPVFFEQELSRLIQLQSQQTDSDSPGHFIYLEGLEGDGRTVLSAQYADREHRELYVLELASMLGRSGEQTDAIISEALTLLSIHNGALLIRGCTPDNLKSDGINRMCSLAIRYLPKQTILFSGEKTEVTSLCGIPLLCIPRLLPGVHTRLAMWQYFAKGLSFDEQVHFEELADCYELSVGVIADIFNQLRLLPQVKESETGEGAGTISKKELLSVVYRMNSVHFGTLATRVRAVYTWEDLDIAQSQKQVLMTACSRYKLRNRVGEDWGLAKKNAYGNGVSILLYGPPGTGKTMAAQVIANEIGMELYRIDLSQIVSKYIGETEKNMAAVFEEAQKANVILFFDEADALFSKRTDVNNSNDKHANSETAYLLQKVEEYKGVSILATNLYNNFDSAFVRRLTYAVRFEKPDSKTRYRLWTTTLPKDTPFAEEIDFEFLAENFDLTGSNIKAILYSAAYLGAVDGRGITAAHITRAMKYEFDKLGRMFQKGDFGKYAMYLPE